MTGKSHAYDRRTFLAAFAAAGAASVVPFGAQAEAAGLGSGLGGLLASASDAALTKLAAPGAFYSDPAVRIGLPLIGNLGGGLGGGLGGQLGGLLGNSGGALGGTGGVLGEVVAQGAKLGLADGLVRKLKGLSGFPCVGGHNG